MQERGFYQTRTLSPTSLGIVIAIHGAAITALALAKMDVPIVEKLGPIAVEFVTAPIDPEPVPIEPEIKAVPSTPTTLAPPERIVSAPPQGPALPLGPSFPTQPIDLGPISPPAEPLPEQPTTPDPVRIEARMDGRSVPQPPYPASEERAGAEGSVRVAVTIGADGRVKAVERVSATSDAFYLATERHALRAWRFRPATLDGKPVESRQVITVRFELGR